jgi:hypothetical protein
MDKQSTRHLKPWQTLAVFSVSLMVLIGFGTFFDIVTGIGFTFVYMIAYFNALIIVLPVMILKHFGTGMLIYLPSAIIGFPVEYYMEYMLNPVLTNPWSVAGFCVFLVITGLSADLACRFLPAGINQKWRAVGTGITLSLVYFITCGIAARFFYRDSAGLPPFLNLAYWGLPWLIISSGFGGYTAYAIRQKY